MNPSAKVFYKFLPGTLDMIWTIDEWIYYSVMWFRSCFFRDCIWLKPVMMNCDFSSIVRVPCVLGFHGRDIGNGRFINSNNIIKMIIFTSIDGVNTIITIYATLPNTTIIDPRFHLFDVFDLLFGLVITLSSIALILVEGQDPLTTHSWHCKNVFRKWYEFQTFGWTARQMVCPYPTATNRNS